MDKEDVSIKSPKEPKETTRLHQRLQRTFRPIFQEQEWTLVHTERKVRMVTIASDLWGHYINTESRATDAFRYIPSISQDHIHNV